MDDLVAFLRARLDEDEAAARAAPGENWQPHSEDDVAGASVYDEQWVLLYPERYDHDNALSAKPGATGPQYIQHARDELAAHIARHDPARVLREVEAKRAILAWYADAADASELFREKLGTGTHMGVAAESYLNVIRAFAAVYGDHPDYRQEWKP